MRVFILSILIVGCQTIKAQFDVNPVTFNESTTINFTIDSACIVNLVVDSLKVIGFTSNCAFMV